jgi:hypothetical protein
VNIIAVVFMSNFKITVSLMLLIDIFEKQDEIISAGGQVEPPGMHMIYLPYSDDVRHVEEASTILS